METAGPLPSSASTSRPIKTSTTYSVDEGVEDWIPDSARQSPLGRRVRRLFFFFILLDMIIEVRFIIIVIGCATGSDGSTFDTCEGSHQKMEQPQEPPQQQANRLQPGLELPALFHEGRRASDGLMCQQPASNVAGTPTSPTRRVTVHHPRDEEMTKGAGTTAMLLSEAQREHKALCQQYGSGRTSPRPVLRQVSYKLAQQQPILVGTPVSSAPFHPIAECDGPSSEISPDHDPDDPRMTAMMMKTTSELDEWCRLPSSLAACGLASNGDLPAE